MGVGGAAEADAVEADFESDSGPQAELPWSLANMSEEELAACELSDEDLLMDEDEEEEWRQYDQEVAQYRELMAAAGENPGLSGSAAGSLLADVLDNADLPLGPPGGSSTAKEESEDQEAELDELIQSASDMQNELQELLLQARRREVKKQEEVAPVLAAPAGPAFEIPASYRELLREGAGVIVTRNLGPNTVVLLSRAPDTPELLPEVSEVFRVMGVTILRGWLASSGDLAMDVFEVCETTSGQPLPDEFVKRLQGILERVVRAPAARDVLFEVEGQVPRLDAFFGLPAGGPRPPPLDKVRAAIAGGIQLVDRPRDLGRALVFRGRLPEGVTSDEAFAECQRRFNELALDCEGRWECLLCKSPEEEEEGLLLLVVPAEELEECSEPFFNEIVVFLFALLFTFWPLIPMQLVSSFLPPSPIPLPTMQAPGGSALAVSPSACVVVFGILAASELARRFVSGSLGVRVSLPFVVPSPTLGTSGIISRCNSLAPSRTALFDIATAALVTAFVVSFFFMIVGIVSSPSETSCTWVNPRTLPQSFGRLLVQQAEPWWAVCPGPRPSDEFIPASTALVGGAFGAVITALNALPIAGLDGTALAATAPWAYMPTWLLPVASALLLLALAVSDANAENIIGQVLVFLFAAVLIRPQVAPGPIFRDNVSRPLDMVRSGIGLATLLAAALVLAPTKAPP